MDSVEEQILSYPQLSTPERRDVEAYVENNPEWAPLFRDVRALESSLRGLPEDPDGSPFDPVLTAYVVAEHTGLPDRSARLKKAFSRLEAALADSPELRERADAIRERLERAEAELDPVSHFESLTGHSLSTTTETAASTDEAAEPTPEYETDEGVLTTAQRLVDQFFALPLAVRGAGTAVAVLFGAYVVLFAASRATQSPANRLAAVEVSDQMVESYYSTRTRSAVPARDTLTADDLYLRALSTLRGARTSTLGLFPSYDADSLRRAEVGLKRAIQRAGPDTFLTLEARFYLGKVYLAQERVEDARTQFETVVERDGRRAPDARRILQTLREEYKGSGRSDS
jgi:tetratricopeptide (TPR) repeat protein